MNYICILLSIQSAITANSANLAIVSWISLKLLTVWPIFANDCRIIYNFGPSRGIKKLYNIVHLVLEQPSSGQIFDLLYLEFKHEIEKEFRELKSYIAQHYGHDPMKIREILKVYNIYQTNHFENGVSIKASRINHSCRPNACCFLGLKNVGSSCHKNWFWKKLSNWKRLSLQRNFQFVICAIVIWKFLVA